MESHRMTPGNHSISLILNISTKSVPVSPTSLRRKKTEIATELITVLDEMNEKLTQERSLLADLVNQEYCQFVSSVYQVYVELTKEIDGLYEGIRKSIASVKEEIWNIGNTDESLVSKETKAFLSLAKHVSDETRPFLDAVKELNVRVKIDIKAIPVDSKVSFPSILRSWGWVECSCRKCEELQSCFGFEDFSQSMVTLRKSRGCRHYSNVNSFKVYQCCKQQFMCWKCHDDAQKHKMKGPALYSICVTCRGKSRGKTCESCGVELE